VPHGHVRANMASWPCPTFSQSSASFQVLRSASICLMSCMQELIVRNWSTTAECTCRSKGGENSSRDRPASLAPHLSSPHLIRLSGGQALHALQVKAKAARAPASLAAPLRGTHGLQHRIVSLAEGLPIAHQVLPPSLQPRSGAQGRGDGEGRQRTKGGMREVGSPHRGPSPRTPRKQRTCKVPKSVAN
jgi:hypothetical protein